MTWNGLILGVVALMGAVLLILSGWLYLLEPQQNYLWQAGLGLLTFISSGLAARRNLAVTADLSCPETHCCRCGQEQPRYRYTLRTMYRFLRSDGRAAHLRMPLCNACYRRVIFSDLFKAGGVFIGLALVVISSAALIDSEMPIIALVFYIIGVLPVAYFLPIWLVNGLMAAYYLDVTVKQGRLYLRFVNPTYQGIFFQENSG